MNYSYVLVEHYPIGETHAMFAVADVFADDELTITCTDDGRVIRTFPPGTWRRADTFDANGHPLASYFPTVQP